jgi:hypothetical protein
MSKIIPRLFGGLGNQLFIYACARRLAIKTNSELVIDNISGFKYDKVYKRNYQLHNFNISARFATKLELFYPFSRIRRFIIKLLNKKKLFNKKRYIQQEVYFEKRILDLKPKRTIYLEGYWQSENYFKDIENIIREDLLFIKPTDDLNLYYSELIKNSEISISVHYRFFDTIDNVNNLNNVYYNKAFSYFSKLFPNATYFIFSDKKLTNINTLINERNIIYINHNKSDDSAYKDLWLMSLCKNFIISNSTFSWWGAWLSTYNDKIIIGPKLDKNSIDVKGIDLEYPKEWILL